MGGFEKRLFFPEQIFTVNSEILGRVSFLHLRNFSCFSHTWPRGHKTFVMLNSAEHEIDPAHKCYNANNCWHFNIY